MHKAWVRRAKFECIVAQHKTDARRTRQTIQHDIIAYAFFHYDYVLVTLYTMKGTALPNASAACERRLWSCSWRSCLGDSFTSFCCMVKDKRSTPQVFGSFVLWFVFTSLLSMLSYCVVCAFVTRQQRVISICNWGGCWRFAAYTLLRWNGILMAGTTHKTGLIQLLHGVKLLVVDRTDRILFTIH